MMYSLKIIAVAVVGVDAINIASAAASAGASAACGLKCISTIGSVTEKCFGSVKEKEVAFYKLGDNTYEETMRFSNWILNAERLETERVAGEAKGAAA